MGIGRYEVDSVTTQGPKTRRNRARGVLTITAAALTLVLGDRPALAQFGGAPQLVSKNSSDTPANADTWAIDVSADGTAVAFASDGTNLVALDNNGDSDVFVHDTRRRITSRVSVNWQGEEAHGDSDCPSISAGGRYVAFRSNAWNMVQGGGNVGDPIWEVYLHDRQGPSTVRVSTPLAGGAASADSGCPVISDDGAWIAFPSEAEDLIPDDTNGFADIFLYEVARGELSRITVSLMGAEADGPSSEPTISADGRVIAFTSAARNLVIESMQDHLAGQQVFAYDRTAQTTELISRKNPRFSFPTNAPSCCGEISADGNLVMFLSKSQYFLPDWVVNWRTKWAMRVFVRDRRTGETEQVEPARLDPQFCEDSCQNYSKAAAFSADGRFVAYMNGSPRLLPENPFGYYDQVYIQDLHTGRLRRVTVDPSGYPVRAYPCGGSNGTLSLSGDGSVLALVGENLGTLGLEQANSGATRDAVRIELNCDPEKGACREHSLCPPAPTSNCQSAARSRLWMSRNPPLSARRDRLTWRWLGEKAADGQEFVDPGEAKYNLCVYAGDGMTTQLDAGIPDFVAWRPSAKGWLLKDAQGAVEKVRLRKGRTRSSIKITSSSPALDLPYLPLEVPGGVTVQLHEATTGRCWESAFTASDVRLNRRGAISSRGTTRGAVHAILR